MIKPRLSEARAEVVVSGLPESVDVIAQAGTVAPGSDGLALASGAVFKSFKAVAVDSATARNRNI